MVYLKLFWKCLFSPTLYAVHKGPHLGKYDPNDWERWGENLITLFNFFWNVGIYSSPVVFYLLVRKGYFTAGGLISLVKLSVGLSVILGASYCVRSYGRAYNNKYKAFLNSLEKVNNEYTENTKREIRSYDFDFYAWPLDFEHICNNEKEIKRREKIFGIAKRSWMKLMQSPCSVLGYIVLHTFGIRLIYPGSVKALQFFLRGPLIQGRSNLVEIEGGQRSKIKTFDGNYLDTMFVDRRGKKSLGSTLVVCCEGNAGFYEMGIMSTPIEVGYSVLGWNHPGFAGSSGMPYPEEEMNAIDSVLQFAIEKLGFLPENIVLFGWSIGGYTSAWAASAYPDVKALVLDATFDDLLPLAVPRMPASLEPVVKLTIRQHANLDIARLVNHFQGPILLYRRSEDEVICLEPNVLSTNRGNHLLIKILKQRFPLLVDDTTIGALEDWLGATKSHQVAVYKSFGVVASQCSELLRSYVESHGLTFPMKIGENMDPDLKTKLTLHLASLYMVDYHTTHCTPLPGEMFRIPSLMSQL